MLILTPNENNINTINSNFYATELFTLLNSVHESVCTNIKAYAKIFIANKTIIFTTVKNFVLNCYFYNIIF